MSTSTHKRHIAALMSNSDGKCHYCEVECTTTGATDGGGTRPDNYATKDHIVPKSIGGRNSLTNYVLACYACNHKRGSMLFFCECRDCNEKILDALYDPETLHKAFISIMAFQKPRVYYRRGYWEARLGHNAKKFKTHAEALAFVLN